MNAKKTKQYSHKLSRILRHRGGALDLSMDDAGWVPIHKLLAHLRLTREQLQHMVDTNNKRRLEILGDRIRCSQGHSLEGSPVTLEALERSWRRHEGDALIWHGTNLGAVSGIAASGIQAVRRTHVHLASALDSRVGKRSNTPVMLGVDPARLRAQGVGIFVSQNGVVLARRVPADCIARIELLSADARGRRREVLDLFGVAAEPLAR
jgi:putative RNA 2'-phosphotransferase